MEDEIADHIFCTCTVVEKTRDKIFKFIRLELTEFEQVSSNSTMAFIRRYDFAVNCKLDTIDPSGWNYGNLLKR